MVFSALWRLSMAFFFISWQVFKSDSHLAYSSQAFFLATSASAARRVKSATLVLDIFVSSSPWDATNSAPLPLTPKVVSATWRPSKPFANGSVSFGPCALCLNVSTMDHILRHPNRLVAFLWSFRFFFLVRSPYGGSFGFWFPLPLWRRLIHVTTGIINDMLIQVHLLACRS